MDENIALEETIPTEQETAVQTEEAKAGENENPGNLTEDTDPLSLPETGKKDIEVTVPIKFNKESRQLSIEEAAVLAQKGLKFDSMKGVMDKLAYLSASTGKSAEQLINSVLEANEQALSDKVRKLAGNDETLYSKLLALEHGKYQKAFDRVVAAQNAAEQERVKSDNLRVAEEFVELKKEFPEIGEIDSVPEQVLRAAYEDGVKLLDGYLRFKHSEEKKIMAAQKSGAAAAQSSTGSQKTAQSAAESVEDALIKGVWSRN